jgi:hypothetical protein
METAPSNDSQMRSADHCHAARRDRSNFELIEAN